MCHPSPIPIKRSRDQDIHPPLILIMTSFFRYTVIKTTIDIGVDEFFKPEFFFSSLVIRTSFFKTGTWWRIENQHWSGCHNILFWQKLWIRHLAQRLITHVVRLLHLGKMSEKVALVRADWRRGGRPAMCAHFEKYYQPKIVVNVLWRAFWKILSTQNNCQRPMTCILKNIINPK